jgi:tRNA A-37 threonylcarbamoyl transferase component Bud32
MDERREPESLPETENKPVHGATALPLVPKVSAGDSSGSNSSNATTDGAIAAAQPLLPDEKRLVSLNNLSKIRAAAGIREDGGDNVAAQHEGSDNVAATGGDQSASGDIEGGGPHDLDQHRDIESEWDTEDESELIELVPLEAERILAKGRADRAWSEFKAMVYASSQMDNSIFAGPGHAELTTALGNFRLFKTIRQSTPVVSNLLKLNLLLFALAIFFYTFQTGASEKTLAATYLEFVAVGRLLPQVIVATVVLAVLAGVLWLSQRPKRLKVLPNMMVLRTDLNTDLFSELVIPWRSVEKIELTHVKFLGSSEVDTRVEISTALGVKHCVPLDDLLIDNSEASFINAVRTWAPWAAKQLTFSRAGKGKAQEKDGRLTELWLHQFNTTDARKHSGMLTAGTEIHETDAGGNVLRSYKLLGIIGGGGQGNTYLACVSGDKAAGLAAYAQEKSKKQEGMPEAEMQEAFNRACALDGEVVLKEYIMPLYRGSSVLAKLGEKLTDEANLLARLDHPLVVKVLHHFVNDFRGYLVLEYVEGRSLKELVQREGPQPEEFVVKVAESLLSVLKYMHSFKPPIVHRDLSPDNVMLSIDGTVKVVDFNLARQLENAAGATVVGKHAYIPPEQFRGRPTQASDLYALGGTLYFLLTGSDPEPLSVSRPRDINPRISAILDDIIARATSLDLSERYGSAGEMLSDLSRVRA